RRGPPDQALDDAAGGRGADAGVLVGMRTTAKWRIQNDNPITFFGWFAFAIVAFIVLSTILGSFFTVNTAQVAVITRFGRFLRVANPGLNWKWPLIDAVSGRVSLRVNQIT